MLYCERCKRLVRGETCPACKKARFLRAPEAGDPVLLCTLRYAMAAMVEPLLEEEAAPYSKVALGAGALLGGSTILENYSFYVPYGAYEGTVEMLGGIFAQDEEICRALREAADETNA